MKQIIIIITYLFFINCHSQKGKIIYNVSTNMAEYENLKKNIDNEDMINETIKSTQDVSCELLFNKNESLFQKIESLELDGKYNLTSIKVGNGKYFYNTKTKITLEEKEVLGTNFIITKNEIKWQLTNETKTISGYNCNKAVSTIDVEGRNGFKKKNITTWYTADIPLNFGPKNYNGLPGLIIILQEGNLYYSVKRMLLNSKEDIIIKSHNEGNEISQKEYDKKIKEFVLNRRKYMNRKRSKK